MMWLDNGKGEKEALFTIPAFPSLGDCGTVPPSEHFAISIV